MRTHYRFVAIAATALAAMSAAAQHAPTPTANPLSRGEVFAPAIHGSLPASPLDGGGNALARAPEVHYAQVTPVPEPSEWLMMAAGIGLGLVVLRRGAWRR